jgi:hypothetical protein
MAVEASMLYLQRRLPENLTEQNILARLLQLNAERAAQEATQVGAARRSNRDYTN